MPLGGIASIHLLSAFIKIGTPAASNNDILWKVIVRMAFVVSALLLAWTDRISTETAHDI